MKTIKDLSEEDFNGHTEFSQMSPEARLAWLSSVAQFVIETRAASREQPIAS